MRRASSSRSSAKAYDAVGSDRTDQAGGRMRQHRATNAAIALDVGGATSAVEQRRPS
jgi:hypothetical protein